MGVHLCKETAGVECSLGSPNTAPAKVSGGSYSFDGQVYGLDSKDCFRRGGVWADNNGKCYMTMNHVFCDHYKGSWNTACNSTAHTHKDHSSCDPEKFGFCTAALGQIDDGPVYKFKFTTFESSKELYLGSNITFVIYNGTSDGYKQIFWSG
ncbi:unnamed protein product [Periconia digitata]|uniref:Uncharacterized protein n=1 Tax=Periconia digitata TaxID=1303443 RepID=A0A9W4UT00_9PLEO|nr:unnamed protein product [Periconia digitata]